jgi:sulfur carrier protein ThiS
MYVRFIVPRRGRRDVDLGLFRNADINADDSRVHEALRQAIRIELDWFNANLPIPRRSAFLVKSRGCWLPDGICWFVDDAREMIARSFTLASLLRECGVPAAKVATRHPGQILYRDAWQIVAKPEEGTPIAWS